MAYRALSDLEARVVANSLAEAQQLFAGLSIQQIYDKLLSRDMAGKNHAVEILGLLFGEAFLSENWLEWGMLLDAEYGDEISIRVSGRDLGCAPVSMIRHRLEDGEHWDLAELRETTIHRLRQLGQHAA